MANAAEGGVRNTEVGFDRLYEQRQNQPIDERDAVGEREYRNHEPGIDGLEMRGIPGRRYGSIRSGHPVFYLF
jgi:hypothetical protein